MGETKWSPWILISIVYAIKDCGSISIMDVLLNKFNYVESFHWWWEGRRKILRTVLLNKTKPKKILDVGCGTGETLHFLSGLFPKTDFFGVDVSGTAVSLSKKNSSGKILKADALNLPFKNNYFDYVLLLDVLEHITGDGKALREAKRVLKKGGKVVITSPAIPFIWSRHDSLQGHKRRYSKASLMKLAKGEGFNIDFIGYFNFFLFFPISAIRLLSRAPFLRWLAGYDNPVNYDIAKIRILNSTLRNLFLAEISLMFKIKYPFGVSILAILEKQKT